MYDATVNSALGEEVMKQFTLFGRPGKVMVEPQCNKDETGMFFSC